MPIGGGAEKPAGKFRLRGESRQHGVAARDHGECDRRRATSIASGLTQGETVVTDGVDKLQPGAKVNVHMATRDVSDNHAAQ